MPRKDRCPAGIDYANTRWSIYAALSRKRGIETGGLTLDLGFLVAALYWAFPVAVFFVLA